MTRSLSLNAQKKLLRSPSPPSLHRLALTVQPSWASCSDTLSADIGSGQQFTGLETREICSGVGRPYRCQGRKCCSSAEGQDAIPSSSPPPPPPLLCSLFCLRRCREFSMIQSVGAMPPVGRARKVASKVGRAAFAEPSMRGTCEVAG